MRWPPRWFVISFTYGLAVLVLTIWLTFSNVDRGAMDGVTVLFFGAIILPSILGGIMTMRRCVQVLGTFGRGSPLLRWRFAASKICLMLVPICFFLSFQSFWNPGDEVRAVIFTAAMVFHAEMIAFMLLAWDLWWQGLQPDNGRR